MYVFFYTQPKTNSSAKPVGRSSLSSNVLRFFRWGSTGNVNGRCVCVCACIWMFVCFNLFSLLQPVKVSGVQHSSYNTTPTLTFTIFSFNHVHITNCRNINSYFFYINTWSQLGSSSFNKVSTKCLIYIYTK